MKNVRANQHKNKSLSTIFDDWIPKTLVTPCSLVRFTTNV